MTSTINFIIFAIIGLIVVFMAFAFLKKLLKLAFILLVIAAVLFAAWYVVYRLGIQIDFSF